jgi:hypothetical protein
VFLQSSLRPQTCLLLYAAHMPFKNLCALAFSMSVIQFSAGAASAQSPAPPASAPTVPRIDLSIGYQHVKYGLPSRSEPRGFYLDAGFNARNGLGVVVQSAASFSSFDFETDAAAYHDRVTLKQGRVGVRYSRRRLHVTPFGQILIGSRDYLVSRTTTNRSTNASTSGSSSLGADTVGAVGAGVTLHLRERVGLRVTADYERVWYHDGATNGVRLLVGGVYAIKPR